MAIKKKSANKKNKVTVVSFRDYFVKALMRKGRRLVAEKYLNEVLYNFKKKSIYNPVNVFKYSTSSLRPLIALKSIRVGTTVYKVPSPLSLYRQRFLTIQLLFNAASRDGRPIDYDMVADFLLAIYLGEKNPPTDRKFELYREAMRNKQLVWRLKRSKKKK